MSIIVRYYEYDGFDEQYDKYDDEYDEDQHDEYADDIKLRISFATTATMIMHDNTS